MLNEALPMKPPKWSVLRIVVPYAVFSALWIVLSDTVLQTLFPDAATFARLSIYKGWLFVLTTSLLLSLLLRNLLRERQQAFDDLQARMAVRTNELAETTHFLDTILDHISSPIFYKGADLRFRGCNRAYEQAFGVKRQDFIGKSVLELPYLPQAQRESYQAEDAAAMAAGTTVSREAVIPFADGRDHQTLYSVSGFHGPQGEPCGLVGVIVDITPLKEAEAALREAKYAAEAADRLKSAFLATMSHELRTPLNSIIGFTGIILQELPGPLNNEQKKQLGMVQNSARHLLSLINDVLDISKIEAGELTVASERFALTDAIVKVTGIVRPLAEKKGLSLIVDVAPNVDDMVGDTRRVEQVLLNLLSNAIKFTEAGLITLSVKLVHSLPDVKSGSRPGAVCISVADTGMGIRTEDLSALFQPFRQIDSALTLRHEGTGLGLAICQRLAALMGGRIEVESRFGEGSVFSVTLPLDRNAS
ncbi:MAG: PAS domain-containing protein, partial [Aquabacterium sp.]|nr:PAS domain-containing protein [Aquabacterium sp.]